ncbi:MAG: DUF4837 family protein [Candidatus Eisenbacteria bacterium]
MRARNGIHALLVPLLLLAGVAALSCDSLMPAMGSYDEIFVVSDRGPGEELMAPLRGCFEIAFETVQEETLFHLVPLSVRQLKEAQNRKNYLVLVDLSDRNATFDMATKLLGRATMNEALRAGKPAAYFVDNAYSHQQVHAFLLAPRSSAFPKAIGDQGPSIRNQFLQANRRRILEFLLFRGEKRTLARNIYERFGWSIRIPSGFTPTLDHLGGDFFSMMMDRPGRRFFVWWKDSVETLPEPGEVMALRDSLGRLYYEEDFVEPSRTTTTRADFQGREAVRVTGLWQNDPKVIGGPFRSIAFVDAAKRRLYLLDYAVYAPGFTKKYYLWELESVLGTFSLEPPPDQEEGS